MGLAILIVILLIAIGFGVILFWINTPILAAVGIAILTFMAMLGLLPVITSLVQKGVMTVQSTTAQVAPLPTPTPLPIAGVVPTNPPTAADQSDNGCVAKPGNNQGRPGPVTVLAGHRLSVQWYKNGGAQQQEVLESGVWETNEGVNVGAWWDYPNCPIEVVRNQAGGGLSAESGFRRVGDA